MDKGYHELINHARTAFGSGQYRETLKYCQQAIRMSPRKTEAYDLAANCFMILQQPGTGEEYAKEAIRLEPDKGTHYFILANCLLNQRKIDEALNNYASAIQYGCSDSESCTIFFIVGEINKEQGNYQAALINYDQCDRILGYNKYQKKILLSRVKIYTNLNNYHEAEHYAEALKLLSPDEFNVYQLLCQIYLKQEKVEKALLILDEAEKYFKNISQTQVEIGFDRAFIHCSCATSHPEQELQYFNQALSELVKLSKREDLIEKDRYEVLVTMADIYRKLCDYDTMIKICEKIADVESANLRIYVEKARYNLVEGYTNQKKYLKVRKYAAKLKDSENMLYRYHGYYMEARAAAKAAESAPDLRDEAIKLYQIALAYFKNCMASAPGEYLALTYRVQAYADVGKKDKAIELSNLLPEDTRKKLLDYIEAEAVRLYTS